MKAVHDKNLILSLIKDDLINFKLVNGLNEIGLNAGNYFLHLSETIFMLMGFEDSKKTDKLYEEYLKMSKKAMDIDTSESNEPLNELTMEIYLRLNARKNS